MTQRRKSCFCLGERVAKKGKENILAMCFEGWRGGHQTGKWDGTEMGKLAPKRQNSMSPRHGRTYFVQDARLQGQIQGS